MQDSGIQYPGCSCYYLVSICCQCPTIFHTSIYMKHKRPRRAVTIGSQLSSYYTALWVQLCHRWDSSRHMQQYYARQIPSKAEWNPISNVIAWALRHNSHNILGLLVTIYKTRDRVGLWLCLKLLHYLIGLHSPTHVAVAHICTSALSYMVH